METKRTINNRHTTGCLIGTAIGDALGLPYEGLTASRASRMLGSPDRFRFLLGRGMMSDDTEHSCMIAESLIESGFELGGFEASFAKRLRWWLLGVPAGTGLAILRACLRLVLGIPSHRSGVFSAGNGPAMRSAILGAAIEDPVKLRQLVHCSTRITHTDPRAEAGALIVAAAARISTRAELPTSDALFQYLKELRFGADATVLDSGLRTHLAACRRGAVLRWSPIGGSRQQGKRQQYFGNSYVERMIVSRNGRSMSSVAIPISR